MITIQEATLKAIDKWNASGESIHDIKKRHYLASEECNPKYLSSWTFHEFCGEHYPSKKPEDKKRSNEEQVILDALGISKERDEFEKERLRQDKKSVLTNMYFIVRGMDVLLTKLTPTRIGDSLIIYNHIFEFQELLKKQITYSRNVLLKKHEYDPYFIHSWSTTVQRMMEFADDLLFIIDSFKTMEDFISRCLDPQKEPIPKSKSVHLFGCTWEKLLEFVITEKAKDTPTLVKEHSDE